MHTYYCTRHEASRRFSAITELTEHISSEIFISSKVIGVNLHVTDLMCPLHQLRSAVSSVSEVRGAAHACSKRIFGHGKAPRMHVAGTYGVWFTIYSRTNFQLQLHILKLNFVYTFVRKTRLKGKFRKIERLPLRLNRSHNVVRSTDLYNVTIVDEYVITRSQLY